MFLLLRFFRSSQSLCMSDVAVGAVCCNSPTLFFPTLKRLSFCLSTLSSSFLRLASVHHCFSLCPRLQTRYLLMMNSKCLRLCFHGALSTSPLHLTSLLLLIPHQHPAPPFILFTTPYSPSR